MHKLQIAASMFACTVISFADAGDMQYPSIDVSGVAINNITTSILFGVSPSKKQHRPQKNSQSEYVSVVWNQSNGPAAKIVLSAGGEAIRPFRCGYDSEFYFCEFIADRELLKVPAEIAFNVKPNRSANIELRSIAWRAHDDIRIKLSNFPGAPLEKDDKSDLDAIHYLDASIPGSTGSFPSAPVQANLKLRICRTNGLAGQWAGKVELIAPMDFAPSQNHTEKMRISVFKKGIVFRQGNPCAAANGKITANPENSVLPSPGDTLMSIDTIGWPDGGGNPVSTNLVATVLKVSVQK
jgi:hypothetical protein